MATPKSEDLVDKFVESRIVLLVARVGMPAVMAFMLYIGQGWLATLDNIVDRTIALEQRVALVEAGQVRGKEAREEFQIDVLAEMREMRAAIGTLSTKVSGLEATIQAMRDRAEAPDSGLIRQADRDPATPR